MEFDFAMIIFYSKLACIIFDFSFSYIAFSDQ
uniref:Uncharacterized protein n=1 Tax=Arundo donax TaxID=35708 RepID=A0A0A9A0A0_ARUDO